MIARVDGQSSIQSIIEPVVTAYGDMAVGRRSVTGGVKPSGARRIQFDFTIDGKRYRPTLPWTPQEANLRRARERLSRIRAHISAGTFSFTEEFPA